jgi:hypothetical protein
VAGRNKSMKNIPFNILHYTPVSFCFLLSFIRLLDLCRTKPLLVIFAELKVTFISVVSLLFCMFRVFIIIVFYSTLVYLLR